MPTRQEAAHLDQALRLLRAGEYRESEKTLRRLLRRNRRLVRAHDLMGQIAARRNRHEEALEHYQRCQRFAPDAARYCYLIARTLTTLGRVPEAVEWYDRTLARDPENHERVGYKALALENQGDAEAVVTLVEPFRERGAATVEMMTAYVRAKQRLKAHEAAIDAAEPYLEPEAAPDFERCALSFYVAKSQEKLGRYDEAFASYRRANEILSEPFDPRALEQSIDAMIEVFSAEAAASLPRSGSASNRPVFIVGMARSGTTLLEQIIDAHAQAGGVGEIPDIEAFGASLGKRLGESAGFPLCLPRVPASLLAEGAKAYLSRLDKLAPGTTRVVNKSLFNWFSLGLLSLLFPQAYYIDCRRDPLDTCASIYMSELLPRLHPYSTDLASIGLAYRQYERLMEHWSGVLDLKLIRVHYEDVVADLEGEARRLIDFLELPWDDACLRYHASGRTGMSISYEQVQQPIYASSIGRAERFGAHLDPLRQALAEPVRQ